LGALGGLSNKGEKMLETKLTLTAECEDCGKKEIRTFDGDEHGIREEEGQEIIDFLFELEFQLDWESERVSYEETNLYCPQCKKAREEKAA
jgi:Zn finger protein HypA/HybF involved in hydrogenase expression